ncbi:MAG: hypothetical protein EOP90_11200 [Lysobacteraceae bacterium]|nr:MAG: hypothetical protein EOP90_11200 [Xanthomonadaceae bacterium]
MSATQYFQRYSQRENVVTNNVLLLLQRICSRHPRKLQIVLSSLIVRTSGGAELEVGPQFRQQVRGPERVADGLVSQLGFDVLIETKLGSDFDVEQAIGHLAQVRFSPNPVLLLLGRDPKSDAAPVAKIRAAADASANGTRVVVCSFKQLVDECRTAVGTDLELSELVDDFEDFCAVSDLLPVDEQTLFVPPCGDSFDENMRWKLYYCAATRPRRLGRWLGVYREKRVHAIGRIDLVVDVEYSASGSVDTKIASAEERDRILGAIRDAKTRGWDLLTEPHTFYVCSEMVATAFDKDSSGGLPGHRYFDLGRIKTTAGENLTAESIAERLRHMRWSAWS